MKKYSTSGADGADLFSAMDIEKVNSQDQTCTLSGLGKVFPMRPRSTPVMIFHFALRVGCFGRRPKEWGGGGMIPTRIFRPFFINCIVGQENECIS